MKEPGAIAEAERDGGFTLMELLVVVSILAMTAVFVVPWARGTLYSAALQTAAHGLASDLRLTQAAARRENVERTLIMNVRARSYWVETVVPPRAFANGVTVEATVPQPELSSSGEARLRFLPDGSSSGGTVTLSDGRRKAILSVDWINGDVRVGWSH